MFNISMSISITIISLLLIGIIAFVCYYLLSKKYFNRRLLGKGKIRNLPQLSTILLTITVIISIVINIALFCEIGKTNKIVQEKNNIISKLNTQSITINDFDEQPEYSKFKTAIVENNMVGYNITKTVKGDFECYLALPSNELSEVFSLTNYYVYINYIGIESEKIQMESRTYFNKDGNYFGGTGSLKKETLIISNNYIDYYEIEIILKQEPSDKNTKEDWDSVPVLSKSNFIIFDK